MTINPYYRAERFAKLGLSHPSIPEPDKAPTDPVNEILQVLPGSTKDVAFKMGLNHSQARGRLSRLRDKGVVESYQPSHSNYSGHYWREVVR